MRDRQRANGDIRVLVDLSRLLDFMHVNRQSPPVQTFETVRPHFDISVICQAKMFRHRCRTYGAEYLERFGSPDHPRRQHHIGISDCVVRVQVGEEQTSQTSSIECGDSKLLGGGFSAPNNSRTRVEKVCLIVDYDRNGRAGAAWIRNRRSGSKKDDPGRVRGR